MKKTAHISWRQHWFPREMRSQKRAQNPRTLHHPDLGCVSDWLKIFFIQSEVQYPHLGSDASSVCKSFREETSGGVEICRLFHRQGKHSTYTSSVFTILFLS